MGGFKDYDYFSRNKKMWDKIMEERQMYSIEKIIICDDCKGRGIIERERLTDYHNGLYDYWDEKCEKCKGSGRLLEIVEVTTTPFKIPKKRKKG